MAQNKLFEIKFRGVEEIRKIAEQRKKLLDSNIKAAVARTVLWGASQIAEETPVDTGRLRASILGYLADQYGLNIEGDAVAISEGKGESTTAINGNEGRIGTNVKYVLHVEYGHIATGPKKLTPKQLRYLFASGILTSDSKGNVIPGGKGSIHKRINRRAGISSRVKGKGMFRKNIPLIDRYFHEQVREAIKYTERGELMPVTF